MKFRRGLDPMLREPLERFGNFAVVAGETDEWHELGDADFVIRAEILGGHLIFVRRDDDFEMLQQTARVEPDHSCRRQGLRCRRVRGRLSRSRITLAGTVRGPGLLLAVPCAAWSFAKSGVCALAMSIGVVIAALQRDDHLLSGHALLLNVECGLYAIEALSNDIRIRGGDVLACS